MQAQSNTKVRPLMTRSTLGSTGIAKDEITNESADGDRQHDPPVVGHKQQHDEERVEDLHGIEAGLEDLAFLLRLSRVPSWPKQ